MDAAWLNPVTPEGEQTAEPAVPVTVVGIDLSLTGTGVAQVAGDQILTTLIESRGRKDATLAERAWRLSDLKAQITNLIPEGALVVIEGPAFASTSGSHHDRSGLWWLVVEHLFGFNRVVEVPPSVLKKAATGKGNASKDEVLAAAIRRYPQAAITNNNTADAVVLAALGSRHLGRPLEADTVKLTEAYAVVKWPGGDV